MTSRSMARRARVLTSAPAALLVVLTLVLTMAACIRDKTPVSFSGGEFVTVSGGESHTCGVKTNGSVVCWGMNEFGQASPPSVV